MDQRKKQTIFPASQLKDHKGNTVDLNYTRGLPVVVDMTSEAGDIHFRSSETPVGVFVIPIELGTIKVQLLDQEDGESYTYSEVEVDAYLGRPFEGRVRKIYKDGTTCIGVKVVW
jgi:hypothetical protein